MPLKPAARFLLPIFVLVFSSASAQFIQVRTQYHYKNLRFLEDKILWEIGASAGIMNSLTDVGQTKKHTAITLLQADFNKSKLNASVYGTLRYKNFVSARLELTYGRIAADDSNGSTRRKARNLNFRSSIKEVALVGEMDLVPFLYGESYFKLNPYVALGVGYFSFKPQTTFNGKVVDLQPLRTEGQGFAEYPKRKPYKLASVNIPFGLGLKYDATPKFTYRLEFLARYTLTDYLDDASDSFIEPALFNQYFSAEKAALAQALAHRYKQIDPSANLVDYSRGGKFTRDMYMSINLKIGYVLGRNQMK